MLPIKRLYLVFIVVCASFVQHLGWLSVLSIKPNIILALLAALIFFTDDFIFYFILTASGLLFLKIEPMPDWPILVLAAVLLAGYWLARILPWQKIFNLFLIIVGATVIFYAIISWQFIFSHSTLFVGEILYNLILGLVFYYWLERVVKP